MIEEHLEIHMADGIADAVVLRPDGPDPRPGVITFPDIRGIRPASLDLARQVAARGHVVLVPNVFYRTARPPIFDFEPRAGDERTMKRFAELTGPLTPDVMERDGSAYVDCVAAHTWVRSGGIGIVGFCFSGAMALRTAAARPGAVAAVASFHGGGLATDSPASPHLLLPKIQARLYFGHAVDDRSMPADSIKTLEAALAEWRGDYESELYDGAHHGWTMPDNAAYNEPQAARAFGKLMELFEGALKAPAWA